MTQRHEDRIVVHPVIPCVTVNNGIHSVLAARLVEVDAIRAQTARADLDPMTKRVASQVMMNWLV